MLAVPRNSTTRPAQREQRNRNRDPPIERRIHMADLSEVTDQNFQAEVLDSSIPVVVDFWAEWCAPCRAISPIIKELSEQYVGQVKVLKMNVDENQKTMGQYDIRAIPTVLAFQGGRVVEQLQGARPKSAFEEMIKKLL
jgi:thioredoxin 1